jgi:AsmA-like C-terminal region
MKIQFKVEKGRVSTKPFDMMVAGQKLTLFGSTGLDQTIDYTGLVVIPRAALGTANGALNGLLAQANAKAGTNVKLSEMINVNLGLGGTFSSPTVTTNLGDLAKKEAGSVKDQLMGEADKKRKELEAKAKAEAERLKKEAEAQVNATKAKAQAEADKVKAEAERLKKEAEAKAQAEKEKAKKQAEEEAKKKLKGLFGK